MSNHALNIDTGAGSTSRVYVHGSLTVTMRKDAPSSASARLSLTTPGMPYDLDQAATITNGATTYFTGTVAAPVVSALNGPVRTVTLAFEGADAILGATGAGRRAGPRITGTYSDTAAGDIIKDLNTKRWGSVFTTTDVDDGPVIPEIVFEDETGLGALRRIEEAARGFVLTIDASASIQFKHADDLPAAPFDLVPGARHFIKSTLRVSRGAAAYYNKVVVYGPEQEGQEIKEIIPTKAHGVTYWGGKQGVSKFPTPSGGAEGDSAVVDTTNAVTYNARRRGATDDTLGASHFLYQDSQGALKRNTTLTSGNIDLQVSYKPRAPLVYALEDREAIDRRGGRPGGLYEAPPLILGRLVPYAEAVSMALAFLAKHAARQWTQVTFQASTTTAGVTLCEPGQKMTVTLPEEGLSGTFIVSAVVMTQRHPGDEWLMTVTAYQGNVPRSGGAAVSEAVRRARTPPTAFTDLQVDERQLVRTWRDDIGASVVCSVANV